MIIYLKFNANLYIKKGKFLALLRILSRKKDGEIVMMSNTKPTESVHYSKKTDNQDPFEEMMKRTGCLELHYKVQDCMFEHRDWRQCRQQVDDFRVCFERFKREEAANRATKSSD